MRPVIHYPSPPLVFKSYKPARKPARRLRIRPVRKLNIWFRPSRRFGAKPQLEIVP